MMKAVSVRFDKRGGEPNNVAPERLLAAWSKAKLYLESVFGSTCRVRWHCKEHRWDYEIFGEVVG
jgi:hypothetical protein